MKKVCEVLIDETYSVGCFVCNIGENEQAEEFLGLIFCEEVFDVVERHFMRTRMTYYNALNRLLICESEQVHLLEKKRIQV